MRPVSQLSLISARTAVNCAAFLLAGLKAERACANELEAWADAQGAQLEALRAELAELRSLRAELDALRAAHAARER
jgi:hypothetical protein